MNQNFVKSLLMNNVKGEGREMIDWEFYDSLHMTASVTQTLTFFQNTIGTVGRVRTNMKSAGSLPAPQSFACTGISFHTVSVLDEYDAGGAAPSVMPKNALFSAFTWDFKLEPSTDFEGFGFDFWKPTMYMNNTGTTLGVAIIPREPYKIKKFDMPILVPTNRAFSVVATLTLPADVGGFVAATSNLYCTLYGYLRRNS